MVQTANNDLTVINCGRCGVEAPLFRLGWAPHKNPEELLLLVLAYPAVKRL